jgi:UDP-N-acetylmuramoylalanine--D-glutamate ligase
MKTLVIGLGLSGTSVCRFLLQKGIEVIAYDDGEIPPLEKDIAIHPKGAAFDWQSCDQVVVSPGISPSHPLYDGALKSGVEVISEVELAFRYLSHRKMVGITGTNGKSTVTLLVAHLLQEAGLKARAVGNIGEALINEVLHPDQTAILSIELSSFQLERVQTKSLMGGVILNLTPDHLDRYPTMESYAEAKGKISTLLHPQAPLLLNRHLQPYLPHLFQGNIQLLPNEDREQENISAARTLVKLFGVSDQAIEKGLKTFQKPPHRIEFVREKEGITYFNDSKSTNLDSTIHALLTLKQNILLIAGGLDKGFNFSPWKEFFHNRVKSLFLIGQAAHRMEKELQSCVPIYQCGTLKEALLLAKTLAKKGDQVLLSPGCSSYDQFQNYADRGNQFKALVNSL